VVSRAQLAARGVDDAAIRRAVASGRLFAVHRHVYSTIDPELLSTEGRLAAAVLLSGRGGALCATTAAWWLKLLPSPPAQIHVAVRQTRRPLDGIVFHELRLRRHERGRFKRMPVTSPQRTALDIAGTESLWTVKRVLAEMEFRFGIEAAGLLPLLRKGHPGSRTLREAIRQHTPQLAQTRSELEAAFAGFLADRRFKQPQFNHPVGKSTVDAVYPAEQVAIELDGVRGHKGERRILHDHQRDLHRRADGYLPLRYHFAQLRLNPDLVDADLERAGIPRVRDPR
jgi:very-short-patch-repair endonuclease